MFPYRTIMLPLLCLLFFPNINVAFAQRSMSFNGSVFASKLNDIKVFVLENNTGLPFKSKGEIRPAVALNFYFPIAKRFGVDVGSNLDWLAFNGQFAYKDDRTTINQHFDFELLQINIPVTFCLIIKKKLMLGIGFGLNKQFNLKVDSKVAYQSMDSVLYQSSFVYNLGSSLASYFESRLAYQINKQSAIVVKYNFGYIDGRSEQDFQVNKGNALAPPYFSVSGSKTGLSNYSTIKVGYQQTLWHKKKPKPKE